MLTLTLFRHAKSGWESTASNDHTRPLNNRGLRDAPVMAQELQTRGVAPDRCLVSSATRTRETIAACIDAGLVNQTSVVYFDELYLASAEKVLDVVQTDFISQTVSPQSVLVLAHNPGLEVLANTLSGFSTGALPTAAVAHFKVQAEDFAVVNTANTTLDFCISPKNLNSFS